MIDDDVSMKNKNTVLDPNIPMHHQIYIQLRMEILDGLWVGRSDFFGEEELAAKFNVSKITSRRALERLDAERLIRRERGRRTVVIYDPRNAKPLVSAPAMFPLGPLHFEYKVLSIGVAIVPAEACAAFDLPPGSHLWSCSRLRSFEGRPHSITLNVQTPEFGAHHAIQDLEAMPMPLLLARAGKAPVRLYRRLGVALPSMEVARYLGISLQDSTLVYTYTLFDENEEIVEWVRIHVHPREPVPLEKMNLIQGTWEMLDVI